MNEREKIDQIKKDILNMAKLCKDYITRKKEFTEKEKEAKTALRNMFLELPENLRKDKLKDDSIEEVSIQFPKSFDMGLLGINYPELYKKYVKTEMVIVKSEKVNFNKKDLQRFHPEEYNKCMAEGTPRIRIK